MFKKLLFDTFILYRLKVDPRHMLITTLALYITMCYTSMVYGGLFIAALFCFSRIAVWICIAWIWAEIIFFNKYSWLRDRRQDTDRRIKWSKQLKPLERGRR